MKVHELLDGVSKQDLVLPEFQREFVWDKEQAKQLLVSLTREYPIGSLLFWKTDDPPALKNLDEQPDTLGTVEVILDGQQRLTALQILIRGEIPPYYTEKEIENNPQDLHYNLLNGEFEYYQAGKMKDDPVWQRVIDCFPPGDVDPVTIAEQASQQRDAEFRDLVRKVNDNLRVLKNITNVDIPVQYVPPAASLDDSIDIFDRVNSQGTKLSDAELALAHVTGKWPDARREMKNKIRELEDRGFEFDLKFMTRALTAVTEERAVFEALHGVPRDELVAGWKQLSKILDYLANILPNHAYIHSTSDLNTTNVLVPLIAYLALNKERFPNERARKNAIHWLYAAHTRRRYTSQTDQRLEHDISLIVREESPWESLREQIIDQRGRIDIKPSDFEGRGIRHPLYNMMLVVAKAYGAVDWFNGAELGETFGDAYEIHKHHIFPRNVLYSEGYSSENYMDKKKVNEIANRAFITADTNYDLSDTRPSDYLPKVQDRYPGALESQFVPPNPDLWTVERYEQFLAARREEMARELNEFMDGMITEPEESRERPIEEVIERGESLALEFKSTLQWDVYQEKRNTDLRKPVLKTIAGFANTDGGRLVIGVEDDGSVYGLEKDLSLTKGSTDDFEQLLTSLISDYIGPEHTYLVEIRFESVDGQQVCVVDVDRSTAEPIFLQTDDGKEFYKRVGNTTRPLDHEQTVRYIENNWD